MSRQLTNHMRPFSHVLGESCMLPGSAWKITAYPTRISLQNLSSDEEEIFFSLAVTGPIKGYTLMQDLQRDFVRVYGTAKEGYFSLALKATTNGLHLLMERCPSNGLEFFLEGKKKRLRRKETYLFALDHEVVSSPNEKIHFGCHKKQDWTLIKRRALLEEILPLWFAVGQKCPQKQLHYEGTAKLFKTCEIAMQKRDRLQVGSILIQLFQVGFHGMLTPRLFDADYQGIISNIEYFKESPLVLLSYGAQLIRRLFLEVNKNKITLLPCLPVELHTGNLFGMKISNELFIDIEWSKKTLRRLVMYPKKDQSWTLQLQKDLKSFRMEGKRVQKEDVIHLKMGNTYHLDRFEK